MTICNHLKPILEHELDIGNKIKEISKAWTEANIVVDLENPLDFFYIDESLKLEEFVNYWENNDTHYLIQAGYYCEQCSNSIAGPQK